MSVEILRLHVSDVTLPATFPYAAASEETRRRWESEFAGLVVSNYAYLVRSEDGVALWDTGLGPRHSWLDETHQPRRYDLPTLLGSVGSSIDEVDVVANCHLHWDHCGGNFHFPSVPIVVQAIELGDARQPFYSIPEWVDFEDAKFEVVDGDREILPGVRVVPTPGHTRGHQSLVVATQDGDVILAGQAAYSAVEFESDEFRCPEGLEVASRESLALLKSLSPARVLFAHDASEWAPA